MSAARDVSREAFAALPVFEQDFENAVQMLMFQDQKVAQLSLENAQQTMSQRAKRVTYEQVDAASFCSDRRKRQRVGAIGMKCNESEGGFEMVNTQLTALCGDIAHQVGTNDRQETRDDSCGREVPSVSGEVTPKSRTMWGDGCIETTRERVGRSKLRMDGGDKYEQLYREEKSMCSKTTAADTATTMKNLDVMPTLFSTGSGKTVLVSKSRLRECEEKLNSEEELACNDKATVAATTTMNELDVVPSLFSTGSGKTVLVSKSRLRECEEKLNSEEELACNDKATVAATTTMNELDVVPSLFSTGSGKTVLVSKSRLRECEEKLNSEEELACNDKATAASTTTMDELDVVPSLFSTGSGKTVLVSKSRLRECEEKLNSEEELACNDKATVAATTTMDELDVVPSLFSTGSGKTVLVSKSRLRECEEKLNSEEELACNDKATAASTTTMDELDVVPSLFSTGSGKTVLVSKSRLRECEEKLNSEEELACNDKATVAATTTMDELDVVPSLFSTGSGKTVLVSKSRLRECEEKLNSEEQLACNDKATVASTTTMDELDVVPSLFSTGSGKTVLVSKSRLRECEEKLNSEEELACNDKATVAATTTMDELDVVPSLFSTGSGKTVLVSESQPRACEGKLYGRNICSDLSCDASRGSGIGLFTKGSRSGWKEIANGGDQASDLDLPSNNQPNMQCGSLSVGVKLSGAGRNRDASAVLGRSRKTLHDHAIPHSPRSQRLNYGDKENIYPKDVQVLKAAASKPCKGWRPTLDKNQLSLRPAAEYRERQCLRQQKVFKRLLRPFRSEAVGKSRFHPPVPSKRSSTCNVESSGRLAVSRSEKEKRIAFDVQPFVYQEVMKISLSSLMALYKDCILAEADSDLFRRQILDIITAENAVDVRFTGNNGLVGFSDNNVDDGQPIGPRDLYHQLRARKHIWKKMGATFAWFLNHYRWVVWKLAATERSFPRLLLGKYLTKDQVVRQIAYRYQHDVTDAKRSILKKILNRDASSLSCVVLCIAAVLPYPADLQNDPIDQECPACFNLALVLTDGWYSVYAVPDAPLATVLWNLHAKSSIIGTKIAAWNALLQNSVEGIDPLECAIVCESQWKHPLVAREDLTRWPYLRLRYNSTRRVRFDTRLGVERLHHAVSSNSMQYKQQPQLQFSLLKSVPLKCLEVGGGMVRSVRVRVTRISSVLHLQAKDWTVGPRILCDDQLPLYFQLRSEYARAAMLKNHKQNGVDIVENDCLDHDQDNAPPPIPFIKVDVECTHICADYNCGLGYGILTIWRPSEELLCGGIKEGVEYFVSKLNVRWKFDGGRSHDAYVQLSSTRHSTFEEVCNIISSTGDGKKSNAKLKRGERICVDIQQATDRYWSTLEDGLSGYGNDWRPKVDVCVYVVLVTAPVTQDDSTAAAKRHQEASLLDPAIRPVESRYVKHVFVTDQSCRLMSIRVTGTNVSMPKLRHYSPSTCASSSSFVFCRGNKDVWKEGSIICLSGLEISHYDEHLDVLDCILVESTQIVSSPSKRSLFWERFSLLHCEAGISAKHLFAAQALPSFGSFAEKLALLKKHVERDILGIDLAPSQSCNEHYATLVEQKRHGRDRWPQEGGADATGTARTDQAVSKSSRLSWKASVFKITLLTGNSRFMFPSGVIASACVNVGTDDVAYRTVYLTRKVLFSMEALLLQAGMFCREGDGFIDTKHEDTVLVDTISKVLRQPEMNYLFRFEVSRIENECLAGSWKPWEHLHALYWLAETVTAALHGGSICTNIAYE